MATAPIARFFVIRSGTSASGEKVERLQRLWGHVALFLLINVVAGGIDLVDGARGDTFLGLDWAHWLLIPWTVILVIHVISFLTRTGYDIPTEPPPSPAESESERTRHLVSR